MEHFVGVHEHQHDEFLGGRGNAAAKRKDVRQAQVLRISQEHPLGSIKVLVKEVGQVDPALAQVFRAGFSLGTKGTHTTGPQVQAPLWCGSYPSGPCTRSSIRLFNVQPSRRRGGQVESVEVLARAGTGCAGPGVV